MCQLCWPMPQNKQFESVVTISDLWIAIIECTQMKIHPFNTL